jgi:hypothetical protein
VFESRDSMMSVVGSSSKSFSNFSGHSASFFLAVNKCKIQTYDIRGKIREISGIFRNWNRNQNRRIQESSRNIEEHCRILYHDDRMAGKFTKFRGKLSISTSWATMMRNDLV